MNAPSFSLAGRRALVTGSSQGIGLALAQALAAAGAQVVLNGRDPARLATAATGLRAAGHAAIEVAAFDVTDESAVQAAAAGLGAVDILVNNTGIQRRGPLESMPLADWHAVLQTNLTSAFLVTRAVAPGMIARRRGKIINICSLMSDLARPTTGNYAAAKGGLKMLTRAMCAEWAQHNIQVNGLAPGYILTELTAPLAGDPKFDAWIKGRTPAGRWGCADDLTGACVFLASPAADFINGQILTVDGGLSAVI
ncbi:Gluconate 5-dehydrogenase [Lacunisphaera limnophila]|uniref:Gluconate 5-dehydrogenase n=1 Tax=Lacunisphaera limnophila TaxID=1838286 RepID=A0A1D8ATH2_9BACT|nr:SDR family oxidoreductase [Lacunisphaera limnophila]AOS44205.1 Gluconate 5-dehydrogenase [Lacunisphaera limnophila]